MSDYEQKDNAGYLGKNKRQRNDKDPGYSGSIRVAGVDYWLSAWLNTSKAGEKYFSLKVNPKQADPSAPALSQPAPAEDDSQSVPF